MAISRHNKVVNILYQLSKKYKPYGKVCADHISKDYRTISILTQISKRGAAKTYPYTPDLWCKHKKNNKIDIFEVWDNQSEDACVEDILFSALTPNINCLSIVCFDKYYSDLATELCDVILHAIHKEDGKRFLYPKEGDVLIALIPQNKVGNEKEIKRFLYKQLEF